MFHPRTIDDLRQTATHSALWRLLAVEDIRRRYRRSLIGPFWLTLSTGLMVLVMGVLYGAILRVEAERYMPHFAIGLVLWQFISATLNESTTTFVESAPLSRQLRIPWTSLVMRIVTRNLLVFAHNLVIIAIVLVVFAKTPTWTMLLVLPGFALVMATILTLSMGLAIAGVRFRDIAPSVQNLLQISFFVTPILWLPEALPSHWAFKALNDVNLFHHMIELVRAPLTGQAPAVYSWVFVTVTCAIGAFVTLWAFNRVRSRIVFWC